ncbi:MAG: hypothetical protein ACI8QC_002497 [Planctomycetota bacterium]|jgi:hypothetical protein
MIHLADLVALVGGIVHSLVPGAAPIQATILLDGAVIQAVGPDLEIPAGSEVIDLGGLHVIPGLVDGMINFDGEHDSLYVSAGVTTVRDVGNDLGIILEAQLPGLRDRMPGPSLLTCGKVLDGSKGVSVDAIVLDSPAIVPGKLDLLLDVMDKNELELDFLSVLETLPADVYRATLVYAQARGLPLWGPLPAAISLEEAISLGQAGFLGLESLLPKGSNWNTLTRADLDPAVALMTAGQTAFVPMLGVYSRILTEREERPGALDLLAPTYESRWMQELLSWREALNAEARKELEQALELQRSLVFDLWEAGVVLLPGSAAPNSWRMPGPALVDELDQLVLAGIEPAEVLRLATAGAAEVFGHGKLYGKIAKGMRADLVVLGSDPTVSLTALRDPELVIVRGRVLERPDLQARLEVLKKLQADVRAVAAAPLFVPAPDVPDGALLISGRAETWALNQRQSAEHFTVLRQLDGSLLYATRIRYPGNVHAIPSEMRIEQVVRDGLLESFDVHLVERSDGWDAPDPKTVQEGTPDELLAGDRSVTVRGRVLGQSRIMNVERRMHDFFISNDSAPDPIAMLDASLVLDAMIVARHFPEGVSYAISLEGSKLEGATDRWTLRRRTEDNLLQVQTSRGSLAFSMDAKGQPIYAARQRGTDVVELRMLEFNAFGGPGLGIDPSRVYIHAEDPVEDPVETGAQDDDK